MPVTMGAVSAGVGLAQSVIGDIRASKARKQLEGMRSPTYNPNASILDFYNKAKEHYAVNPYDSALYRMQAQNAQRGTAQGLSALRGRGGAISGVSSLVSGQDDALLRAGATAEGQQAQNLNMLGHAAGMKAAEEGKAFDINQMQPFERNYQLAAMKMSGGNQVMNAGMQNIYSGVGAMGQGGMLKSMYGGVKVPSATPQTLQMRQVGVNPDGSPHFGYN